MSETPEPTPDPVPVDPNEEPAVIRPSATGLVVPDDSEPDSEPHSATDSATDSRVESSGDDAAG